MTRSAWFALADGSVWRGEPFGASGARTGEAVFNTALTGYQEILTDPSYCRQIVVMTAPHIGNTGVNDDDDESGRVWASGLVVRSVSLRPSSWRATGTLGEYLHDEAVPAISGVDTRSIVRRLRDGGAQHAAVVTDGSSAEDAVALARSAPDINGMDLVGEVTCRGAFGWKESSEAAWYPLTAGPIDGAQIALPDPPGPGHLSPHVVVVDMGVKRNTLRLLARAGCVVTVVPARTPAAEILARAPDGILLSNGPGDPAMLTDIVDTVRQLLGQVPVFGICLGHQLLGLALGGHTYKLKFGHRGANQPVRGPNGLVAISSHNHGYAVAREGLPTGVVITHDNLNDGCVEGLEAPALDAWSVQYHPEAAPGPHDAAALFDEFVRRISAQSGAAAWPAG